MKYSNTSVFTAFFCGGLFNLKVNIFCLLENKYFLRKKLRGKMDCKLAFVVLILSYYVACPSMGQVNSTISSAEVPVPKDDMKSFDGKQKMDQSTSLMTRSGPPISLVSRLNKLENEFREKIEDIKTQTGKSIKDQNEKIMGLEHKLAHLLNQSMEVVRELKTQNKDQSKRIEHLEQKVAVLQKTSPTSSPLTMANNKGKIRTGATNNKGQVSKALTPPSSCQDLAMLDYYLDGLYLVKQTKNIQTVLCKFSADNKGYETIIGYNDIKTAPISFLVTSDNSNYNKISTTIPFDTEVFNLGGAMNPRTGVFTAPKNGRYSFSFKTRSYYNKDAQLYFRVNGNRVLYVEGYTNYGNMPISTVLDLKANDRVDCYLKRGSIDHNIGGTFFSGILLEEDLVLP